MAELSPEIVELEAQEAIAVRGDLPATELTDFFGRAFGEAVAAAEAMGATIVGPPFGFYPELPTDTVVVEAGIPVAAATQSHGNAHPLVLPGGRAATVVHVGPYDTLTETYAALEAWMAQQGLQPTGGMWESYLTDPGAEPDPATWRTQVVCPIA